MIDRSTLEAEWRTLVGKTLPELAPVRGWPIRFDHCFARVLLDTACGGVWYDHIAKRPAYAHAPDAVLRRAVDLGTGIAAGLVALEPLNTRSIAWRRARKAS